MKSLLLKLFIVFGLMVFGYTAEAQVVKKKPRAKKGMFYKPKAPSKNHVWITGEWRWSHQKNTYIPVKSAWVKRKRGLTWVAGHWKRVPRGYKWVRGHWAKRPVPRRNVKRRGRY